MAIIPEGGFDIPDSIAVPGFDILPVSQNMKDNQKYLWTGIGIGVVAPIILKFAYGMLKKRSQSAPQMGAGYYPPMR
jgi:hypothetical protein